MTAKRTINAKEVVRDIRSHMTDEELMEKYRLSARGLQSVLKKLLESKLITQAEFDWRPVDYDDTVFLDLESPDSKE
jgi:transcription initiation factor IIE alpha subunit